MVEHRIDSLRRDCGLIYASFAIALTTLLLLIALAVGIGFLASNKSRLQSIANLAVLAAVDNFITNTTTDDRQRQDEAVARANLVLGYNRLHGTNSGLGGVTLADGDQEGGILHFGRYFRRKPEVSDPCSNSYPCFQEISAETSDRPNALHLKLRTQDGQAIANPVSRIIGPDQFNIETHSTATLVNTCLGHLLDVSVSTVTTSHRDWVKGSLCQGSLCGPDLAVRSAADLYVDQTAIGIQEPVVWGANGKAYSTASLFAFNAAKIFEADGEMRDCTSTEELLANYPDLIIWCNMARSRKDFVENNIFTAIPPTMYFRSDYEQQRVFGAELSAVEPRIMLVNKNALARPEPMRSFFLGANMALRVLDSLPAEANRGFFRAFTGQVAGRSYPLQVDDPLRLPENLTNDLAFLAQLTNMNAIGDLDRSSATDFVNGRGVPDGTQIHPNLLDFGFFPMDPARFMGTATPELAAANIPLVLYQAANHLSGGCDEQDRKAIFLYTDGISTCSFNPYQPGFPVPGIDPPTCDGDPWSHYQNSEWVLLNGLIPYLRERGVAVTVFFAGEGIIPNYRNVPDPEHFGAPDCTDSAGPACYLDFNRAQEVGYGGPPPADQGAMKDCGSSGEGSFYDCSSYQVAEDGSRTYLTPEQAFRKILDAEPNIVFGRPLGLMGELATRTGGIFCPLMPAGDPADYYDHDEDCPGGTSCCQAIFDNAAHVRNRTPCVLRNSARENGKVETRALEYIPMSLQAARCAQRALTQNPYILVEPLKIILD